MHTHNDDKSLHCLRFHYRTYALTDTIHSTFWSFMGLILRPVWSMILSYINNSGLFSVHLKASSFWKRRTSRPKRLWDQVHAWRIRELIFLSFSFGLYIYSNPRPCPFSSLFTWEELMLDLEKFASDVWTKIVATHLVRHERRRPLALRVFHIYLSLAQGVPPMLRFTPPN